MRIKLTNSIPQHHITMELSPLRAISPIDGRYWSKVSGLSEYFSEYSLFRYRVLIEVEYFIALFDVIPALVQVKQQHLQDFELLRALYKKENFTEEQAEVIKEIEKVTNHDVKAVEYYLKQKIDQQCPNLKGLQEWIHFGLTSQDINNTSIPLSLREAMEHEYYKYLNSLVSQFETMVRDWSEVPMLARTHGQPATPTRVGKEINVFLDRVRGQLALLKQVPMSAKFGGATGQFNAHAVAFPSIDWPVFADKFVTGLGLVREQWTTQISQYDNLAALFHGIMRINTILIDFSRDMWMYISLGYFKQKIAKNEVGSSAMPHKVNPIDFENAEGNLGLANASFEFIANKLPISRLQRDLTDSTVLRNLGVPFGHTLIAFQSLLRGMSKLLINDERIKKDLEENWVVVSEAIQTVLRREGYEKPYEALKDLTRTGDQITQKQMFDFVDTLKVSDAVKAELKAITPFNFIGVLPKH